MPISKEMRLLKSKWNTGQSYPKRLEWIEILNLRGWTGQRVDFSFPIVAIVGENGSGKSTILQSAASVYRSNTAKDRFASDFFPDTPFEQITSANIRFSYREGNNSQTKNIRKPSDRWRGNPERPKREVIYIDLSRIQPVNARVGYQKLLKSGISEGTHIAFDASSLSRFSNIMGRRYTNAGISNTNVDLKRNIPVISNSGARYSGFHQGAGEITAAELIAADFPKYSLVLIDEVESSLHPRAQRRLIRDLAEVVRLKELQIILTTHSPYVLEEIPPEGRVYIMEGASGKSIVTGVSPEFAMTRMDEEQHPECDIYVEDETAKKLMSEILSVGDRDILSRCQIIPFGSAQVGIALGMMASQSRFPRPSLVFLDGDQPASPRCNLLPGGDVPERVVFDFLSQRNWGNVFERIGRPPAETIDALNRSMTKDDHHEWLKSAAKELVIGSDTLWQALSSVWAGMPDNATDIENITDTVRQALI